MPADLLVKHGARGMLAVLELDGVALQIIGRSLGDEMVKHTLCCFY
jgi:hypothetical protein